MKLARITSRGKAFFNWLDSRSERGNLAGLSAAFAAGWQTRDEEVEELNLLLHNNQVRREEVEMRHGDLLRENERLRADNTFAGDAVERLLAENERLRSMTEPKP